MGMSADGVVDAFIDAINRKDLDAACGLLADDVEYDNVPMAKVHGRDAVQQLLGPMIDGCSEIEWIVHRQACTGSLVMNERLDRFNMAHGWVDMPCAGIFEVSDGQIVLWRDYFDLPTYTNQLPGS